MSAPIRIRIVDEVPGAGRHAAFQLEVGAERVTVRDLIERRVRHEVESHNETMPPTFVGLVRPAGAEAVAGGWRLTRTNQIDADAQVHAAWDAFARGRVLLLIDDRQIDGLDDVLVLRPDAEVCFFKLVPLVGG
jgi:hypothetical protein